MVSSDALEMRLLIVLSAETSNIPIFSCFSIFNDIFLIARLPTTRSNPITIVTTFIQITAGAATIVEKRATPVISNPIAVTPKQLSITPIILTPLLYFVLSSFRLSLSAVSISCISSNFKTIYIYVRHYHQFHQFPFFIVYNIFFSESNITNHTKNGDIFKWTVRA